MKRNRGTWETTYVAVIIAKRKIRFRSKKTFVFVASPCYLAGLDARALFDFISRVRSTTQSVRKLGGGRFVNLSRDKSRQNFFLGWMNSVHQFSTVSFSLNFRGNLASFFAIQRCAALRPISRWIFSSRRRGRFAWNFVTRYRARNDSQSWGRSLDMRFFSSPPFFFFYDAKNSIRTILWNINKKVREMFYSKYLWNVKVMKFGEMYIPHPRWYINSCQISNLVEIQD